MNNSTHISLGDDQASCRFGVSVFFTTAMAFISSAAFMGNILVIFSVYKTPSLRTSTNYYYVNMAVSDFFSCLTTWPLYLTDEIITSSGSLLQGPLATISCKVGVYFKMVSAIVSILSLVLIAVDRFIATVFPLKAKLITRKLRAALLFATWLLSIFYCIPMFLYFSVEEVGQETFCRFSWNSFARTVYYIVGLALFEVIPLINIIILYSCVMRVLSKRPKQHNSEQNRTNQSKNVMKIFKSIVIAYFISYSFYCVYLFLKIASPGLFLKDRCKLIFGFAFYLLPSFSTAINPVILFAFSSNFRQALPQLCAFAFSIRRSCCKAKKVSPRQENKP
ncbi:RYamide receptor-like [Oculina patagonica]